jgi:hypothetical protein
VLRGNSEVRAEDALLIYREDFVTAPEKVSAADCGQSQAGEETENEALQHHRAAV